MTEDGINMMCALGLGLLCGLIIIIILLLIGWLVSKIIDTRDPVQEAERTSDT